MHGRAQPFSKRLLPSPLVFFHLHLFSMRRIWQPGSQTKRFYWRTPLQLPVWAAWQNRSEHWISLRTLDFRLFAIETGPNLSDIVEAITRVMYLVSVWVFLWIVIKKKIDQNETVSFYRARFQIHLFQTKPEVRRRSNNVFCVSNNSSGNSKSLTISTFGWKFIRS